MAFSVSTILLFSVLCLTSMSAVQSKEGLAATVNWLKAIIDSMCSANAASPSVQFSSNWTSVAMTSIGSSNLRHVTTSTFTIPSIIPSSAKEVLIFVTVACGTSDGGAVRYLKVFTRIGSARYEKYITSFPYHQNAWNTNSENMWFPMPPNRRIYLTVPAKHGGNAAIYFAAIGYR